MSFSFCYFPFSLTIQGKRIIAMLPGVDYYSYISGIKKVICAWFDRINVLGRRLSFKLKNLSCRVFIYDKCNVHGVFIDKCNVHVGVSISFCRQTLISLVDLYNNICWLDEKRFVLFYLLLKIISQLYILGSMPLLFPTKTHSTLRRWDLLKDMDLSVIKRLHVHNIRMKSISKQNTIHEFFHAKISTQSQWRFWFITIRVIKHKKIDRHRRCLWFFAFCFYDHLRLKREEKRENCPSFTRLEIAFI